MKKNMLIRVLAVICVLACLFAFVSCHDEINATIETNKTDAETALNNAKAELNKAIAEVRAIAEGAATKSELNAALARIEAAEGDLAATMAALETAKSDIEALKALVLDAATKTELTEAVATLNKAIAACATQEALDAVAAKVDANTADIAEIQAAIAELASKTELAEVRKALEDLISANTTDIATIKATLETLATKEYVDSVKTELSGMISALETKLAADIKTNTDAIAALQTKVNGIEGDVTKIKEDIKDLQEALESIDIYGTFEDEFGALTDKLLNPDYEYAYVKFVEIVLDIDEGPYDPDNAKQVRLDAECILFAVTRATSESTVKALYEQLVAIKAGMKTLEESLAEKVADIKFVNTSDDCINAILAANVVYQRMLELNIKFEDADLKAQFERIWAANLELNGETDNKGNVVVAGLKHTAAETIDEVVKTILNRDTDIYLGNNDDENTIANYQAAIVALKDAINNSAFRDLYEAGLADGVIDAVKEEVLAETIADYAVTKADAFKAECIVEYIGTETEGAWADAVVALIAADLKAANAELSEEDALAQAAEAYAADASAYADKLATAYANAEAKANEQDFTAEIAAKVEAAANEYVESDEGNQAIFVIAMAESLYDENGAEAVAERYELMVKAANDAANYKATVEAIIEAWNNEGLLWNNTTATDAYDAIYSWIESDEYKSEKYEEYYTFATANISEANREFVIGAGNYAAIEAIAGYVEALANIYASKEFTIDGNAVSGVEALLVEVIKAVNGVEIDGKTVLLVDAQAYTDVKAALAALNVALGGEDAGKNDIAQANNYNTMISEEIRERIVLIDAAKARLAEILSDIEDAFAQKDAEGNVIRDENGKPVAWIVSDYGAADTIDKFNADIADAYAMIVADPDGVLKFDEVQSSLVIEAIDNSLEAFAVLTEDLAVLYKEAQELVAQLKALGGVKLDHGKQIYDIATRVTALSSGAYGNFTYNTRFPVDGELKDFYVLKADIDKYVSDYATLASAAVTKAAELKDAIEAINKNAFNLNDFNDIMNLMKRINDEWFVAFYSDAYVKTIEAGKDKYEFASNTITMINNAIAATEGTIKVGSASKEAYVFLSSTTFDKIEKLANDAIATYQTVETKAIAWIGDAAKIVNKGKYTYHDWNAAGFNFQTVQNAYTKLINDYYGNNFDASTAPGFGLFAAHEAFYVDYLICEGKSKAATTAIGEIHKAITDLGKLDSIKLDATDLAAKRTTINQIYAAIADFETNYCPNAKNDDFDSEILFALDEYNGFVEIAETWVAKQNEWPSSWNASESFNTAISSLETAYSMGAEKGRDKATVLADFVAAQKTIVDKAIAGTLN